MVWFGHLFASWRHRRQNSCSNARARARELDSNRQWSWVVEPLLPLKGCCWGAGFQSAQRMTPTPTSSSRRPCAPG